MFPSFGGGCSTATSLCWSVVQWHVFRSVSFYMYLVLHYLYSYCSIVGTAACCTQGGLISFRAVEYSVCS